MDPQGCPRASARSQRREVIARRCYPQAPRPTREERKEKSSVEASLRDFTKGSRKSKTSSDAALGRSPQGKQRLQATRRVISVEEESGVRKKWEVVHKKTCKAAMEASEDDEGFDGNEEAEQSEVEETLTHSELAEA